MHKLTWIAILVLAIGSLPGAAAEEMAVEHGKLNTGDASPVDPGAFELELGYGFDRAGRTWDNGRQNLDRGRAEGHTTDLSFTAGLFDNFDAGVSLGYQWLRDDDNDPSRGDALSDLSLGGRYRFLNLPELALEMAYSAGFTLPTGTDSDADRLGTSQEFWSFDQAIAATKDWGSWTGNLELTWSLPGGNKRGDSRSSYGANLAVGYQARPWFQPEAELNYACDCVKNGADAESLAVTLGALFPLADAWRLSAGVQQGLWGRNTDKTTSLVLGAKYAF